MFASEAWHSTIQIFFSFPFLFAVSVVCQFTATQGGSVSLQVPALSDTLSLILSPLTKRL